MTDQPTDRPTHQPKWQTKKVDDLKGQTDEKLNE